MTKKATEQVLKILKHIKDPDAYIEESIRHVEAELAMFKRKARDMRDSYLYDRATNKNL